MLTHSLEALIEAWAKLPGIGRKTAQRSAFYLISRAPELGLHLADCLQQALANVKLCHQCRMFCDPPHCRVCVDQHRRRDQLCVVAQPADVMALESVGAYQGRYFVLHGYLSAIDNMGPAELGLSLLNDQLKKGEIVEIILAMNLTVEAQATAYYVAELANQYHIKLSRIAHGIPTGADLEWVDSATIQQAFKARETLE